MWLEPGLRVKPLRKGRTMERAWLGMGPVLTNLVTVFPLNCPITNIKIKFTDVGGAQDDITSVGCPVINFDLVPASARPWLERKLGTGGADRSNFKIKGVELLLIVG